MTRRSKGYLIPEEAMPPEMDCMVFFIPDDPLYRAALIGSYHYLGTRFAWEDDGSNKDLIARQAWLSAIEVSEENNYMLELNPVINIVNNVEKGECCCDGGGTGNISVNVTINPETTIEPPEPSNENEYTEGPTAPEPPEDYIGDYPTWQEFNVQKCKAANYFAGNIISNLETFRNVLSGVVDSTIGRIITALGLIIADGPFFGLDTLAVAVLVAPKLIDWLNEEGGDTSEVLDFILNVDRCELTQIIYTATDRQNLGQSLGDYLEGRINATVASDAFKTAMIAWVNYAFRSRVANYIYDNLDTVVPADQALVCACIDPVSNLSPFSFDSSLEGWFADQSLEPSFQTPTQGRIMTMSHSPSVGNNAAGSIKMDSADGTTFYSATYTGWKPEVTATTRIEGFFSCPLNSAFGTGCRINTVFTDGSMDQSPALTSLSSGWRPMNRTIDPSHIGKTIDRVEFVFSRNSSAGPVEFHLDDVTFIE